MAASIITTTKVNWVERMLYLDGHPFSLDDYPFYHAIYNNHYDALLMKTGRQVAKSTTLANFMITEAVARPFFKALFVAPTMEQTTKFSQSRIGKTIFYSPEIRANYVSKELSSRVMMRALTNGSELTFSYASDNPDRARGISADRVAYDEVQDIMYDEVIPVINECMANSDMGFETYCGTPKSMENTIEQLWQWSSQTEWVMKCEGCGTYQYFVDDKAIGKKGPICIKCGKYLNVRKGRWVDTAPKDAESMSGKRIKGFHVSQLILPKNSPASMRGSDSELALKRWERLLTKYEQYPPARFKNEVLGVSDAIGTRLLSKADLEKLCEDYVVSDQVSAGAMNGVSQVVAGVDWSGGGTKGTSRTVLWIWGLMDGGTQHGFKLKTLYFKIYPETNPISGGVVDHIVEMCRRYNVKLVMGDAGEGALANANLRERLGNHRALQVQYSGAGGTSTAPFRWNKRDRFIAERTTMIDHYMMFLKREGVIFPNIKQMHVPLQDILNEYEEVTSSGRKVWRHAPAQPDDALHAQIFGWMAAKHVVMDPMFTYNSK